MNIQKLIKEYANMGYKTPDAIAKVGQDIILSKISKSPYINNVTIKGGVVMHNISRDNSTKCWSNFKNSKENAIFTYLYSAKGR